MLKEVNEQISNIKNELAQKSVLEAKLKDLRSQLFIKEEELTRIEHELEKESKDVEKLNRVSLSNIISIIMRNKDEKLQKEQQEYLIAKIKHDDYKARFNLLKEDINKLEQRLGKLSKCEEEYELLLQRKIALIDIHGDEETRSKIISIDEEIDICLKESKELEESIWAGRDLINEIKSCKKILGSAKTWGTIDLLGGDLISSMAKHQKVDEARKHFARISNLLNTFNKELKDVNVNKLNFCTENKTLDIFFDNIFTDISVNNKINESYQDICNLERNVDKVIKELRNEKENIDKDIINKKREFDKLIDNI